MFQFSSHSVWGFVTVPNFYQIDDASIWIKNSWCLQIPPGPPEASGEDRGTVPVRVPPGGAVPTEAPLRADPQSDGGQSYIRVKVIARVCFYIQNLEL